MANKKENASCSIGYQWVWGAIVRSGSAVAVTAAVPSREGEQARLQGIGQNPPGWTAGKKAHAQSEQQVARGKARISELLGLVGNAIRVAQPSLSPLPCGC